LPPSRSRVRLLQDLAVYAGMVEAMDLAVGKVLAQLEELELDERTIVAAHPEKTAELRALLAAWRAEVGARQPAPNPRFTAEEEAR
jgi:arylsulfatase A-like enzyme